MNPQIKLPEKTEWKTSVEWEGEPIVFKEGTYCDLFAGETRLKEDIKLGKIKLSHDQIDVYVKSAIKSSCDYYLCKGVFIGCVLSCISFLIWYCLNIL